MCPHRQHPYLLSLRPDGLDPSLTIERMGEWLLFTLWPAFGFVMASDTGYGGDSDAALGFLMSVVANTLLYGILGVLVSFIYRRFFWRSVVKS
jgi:hypothetical protein